MPSGRRLGERRDGLVTDRDARGSEAAFVVGERAP
jgi:hypothetical protein